MGEKLYVRGLVMGAIRFALSDPVSLCYATVALLLSPLLVGLPFFTGYVMRAIRAVLRNEPKLPKFREDLQGMTLDGLAVCLLFFFQEFMFVSFVFILAFGVLVLDLGVTFRTTAALPGFWTVSGLFIAFAIQLALLFFITLITIAWGCTLAVSAVIYADTGAFSAGINPVIAIDLIGRNVRGIVVSFVALLPVFIVSQICGFLIVTLPFVVMFQVLASAYVMARFYQATIPDSVPDGCARTTDLVLPLQNRL